MQQFNDPMSLCLTPGCLQNPRDDKVLLSNYLTLEAQRLIQLHANSNIHNRDQKTEKSLQTVLPHVCPLI